MVKTNQTGLENELVVLHRAGNPDRCPVIALRRWCELAQIIDGPVSREVSKSNKPLPRHRSLATLSGYVRTHQSWTDNVATTLGL